MTDESTPVAEVFADALRQFREQGLEPTQCTLSLALARRAAQEHEQWRGPMFQSWHPTVEFIVTPAAPPDYFCLSAPPRVVPVSSESHQK